MYYQFCLAIRESYFRHGYNLTFNFIFMDCVRDWIGGFIGRKFAGSVVKYPWSPSPSSPPSPLFPLFPVSLAWVSCYVHLMVLMGADSFWGMKSSEVEVT